MRDAEEILERYRSRWALCERCCRSVASLGFSGGIPVAHKKVLPGCEATHLILGERRLALSERRPRAGMAREVPAPAMRAAAAGRERRGPRERGR